MEEQRSQVVMSATIIIQELVAFFDRLYKNLKANGLITFICSEQALAFRVDSEQKTSMLLCKFSTQFYQNYQYKRPEKRQICKKFLTRDLIDMCLLMKSNNKNLTAEMKLSESKLELQCEKSTGKLYFCCYCHANRSLANEKDDSEEQLIENMTSMSMNQDMDRYELQFKSSAPFAYFLNNARKYRAEKIGFQYNSKQKQLFLILKNSETLVQLNSLYWALSVECKQNSKMKSKIPILTCSFSKLKIAIGLFPKDADLIFRMYHNFIEFIFIPKEVERERNKSKANVEHIKVQIACDVTDYD